MKKRSKRYKNFKKIASDKKLAAKEVIELIKKNSNVKFDESVDVSLRINLKQSKGGDLSLRTTIKLPNGSGKKEKIAIAHPISTSSKSPSKGEEKITLPTIENTFIITIKIKTQPPTIERSVDKYNKKRPNLSSGRI